MVLRGLISVLVVFASLQSAAMTPQQERDAKLVPHARGTVIASPASVVSYSGDTTGAADWVRPFADGNCCSALGPVKYVTREFSISSPDTCSFASVQPGWDGYLFVYRSPFDPAAQTVNFVAADDDGVGGIGTSNIDNVVLAGNTLYTIVTTGFELGEVGPFTNTITCGSATITLDQIAPARVVPTLSPALLAMLTALILSFGAFAVRQRRR